ncbi:MAG: carboxylating nicotinate-nucleotide diphosphorylase [Flavobacteriales bacterium]|nr:carboxylating nicotinate-nucleotide diphosphorylase [Flavobacteriales bacterium]
MNLTPFIVNALNEDLGNGDHTSLACVPGDAQGTAKLLVKQAGILAGIQVSEAVFKEVDKNLSLTILMNDGDKINVGDIVFRVSGSSQNILKAERLVLNCMQRMSGVATLTREYSDLVAPYSTKLLDTRKTTPGFRQIEKMAVKIGGGTNHRFGLFDMIMIKNNHIDYCGGIPQAIANTKDYLQQNKLNLDIEVEARNIKEVQQIMTAGGIKRIMLDNFTTEDTATAVKLIDGQFETESSGNINKSTIVGYAQCGVDYISVGALTHSYTSLDLSLRAE